MGEWAWLVGLLVLSRCDGIDCSRVERRRLGVKG